MAQQTVTVSGDRLDRAAKADLDRALAALELPRIAVVEPGFRQLHLPAVGNLLPEHAVHVADAVAVRGQSTLAIDSMKQAASRPRPPLPSAASGSSSSIVDIDASDASAARILSIMPMLENASRISRPIRNSIDR
jgi:hypothetical protein